MADYKVVRLDLSAAREHEEILSRHVSVASVALLSLSVGATLDLHVGNSKPGIPLAEARGIAFDMEPPEEYGLFVTNAAQVGTAVLLISYTDPQDGIFIPPVVAPQGKPAWWRRWWK